MRKAEIQLLSSGSYIITFQARDAEGFWEDKRSRRFETWNDASDALTAWLDDARLPA